MFEKKIACETIEVLKGDAALLSAVFQKAGKESLSEFELWKAAKEAHITLPKTIRQYVNIDDSGLYRLKPQE